MFSLSDSECSPDRGAWKNPRGDLIKVGWI